MSRSVTSVTILFYGIAQVSMMNNCSYPKTKSYYITRTGWPKDRNTLRGEPKTKRLGKEVKYLAVNLISSILKKEPK